jgi:hypothetical protein
MPERGEDRTSSQNVPPIEAEVGEGITLKKFYYSYRSVEYEED